MAMTQAGLSASIKAQIIDIYGGGNAPDSDATLQKFCDALAKGIVDYIKSNADIDIQAADLTVAPGSFVVGGTPVTGVGQVNPKLLTTRIK